jgi:protein-tyrosine phosphatase
MSKQKIKVLMVCLGNICRSPTAEAIFRDKVLALNLGDHIEVDSAGTGSWHIGHPPDARSMRAAAQRNYDMSTLQARQVSPDDMENFDYIFAMDRQNLEDLLAMSAPQFHGRISLFLHHGNSGYEEVPDPYYSGSDGFELVLDLVEEASANLVRTLSAKHGLS